MATKRKKRPTINSRRLGIEYATIEAYAHAIRSCQLRMEELKRKHVSGDRLVEFIEAKASIENFIKDIVAELK